jgi:HK97 family phage portal protein
VARALTPVRPSAVRQWGARVKAALQRWGGGNPVPPLSHGYVHEPFAGAWQRNISCGGTDALAFSAVFASVTMIAQDIAKLRPTVYRELEDGSKEPYPQHPAQRVLDKPNPFQTRVDFWQHFMMSVLMQGNTYDFLTHDQRGVINGMWPLDPYGCRPLVAEDGSVFYAVSPSNSLVDLNDADLILREGIQVVPARRLMHHREVTVVHPLIGFSPLYAAAASASMGATIVENSRAFFSNMSRASGILTCPGKLDKDLADRYRAEWEQNFTQGSIGRTAVLGNGLEWKPLSINAADAQLIDQLKWNVEDVARCYRVPDWMISNKDKTTFRTGEMQTRLYYQQTLQFRLEAIEARLNETFGLAPDVFIEFDLSTMLRTDIDVRMKAYNDAIRAGVYTINEARREEGRPAVEGGDEVLVQMQYQPISQKGAPPLVPPTEEEPEDTDEDTEDEDEEEELEDTFDDALTLRRDLAARIRARLAA